MPLPTPWMLELQASVATKQSDPPTQNGFVTQYRTAPMPAASRPQVSFIHSYGPPSCGKAVPSSAISRAYGNMNSTTSTTTHVKACAP